MTGSKKGRHSLEGRVIFSRNIRVSIFKVQTSFTITNHVTCNVLCSVLLLKDSLTYFAPPKISPPLLPLRDLNRPTRHFQTAISSKVNEPD